jgi:hypothetical protein
LLFGFSLAISPFRLEADDRERFWAEEQSFALDSSSVFSIDPS